VSVVLFLVQLQSIMERRVTAVPEKSILSSQNPSERALGATGVSRIVRLIECRSGQVVSAFAGHAGQVTSIAFAPLGDRLLSADQLDNVQVFPATVDQLLELARRLWGFGTNPPAPTEIADGKIRSGVVAAKEGGVVPGVIVRPGALVRRGSAG
jgi:hypothetical protein